MSPKLYVLIGVPAAGKSFWLNQQDWAKDCCIISTDFWVDLEASKQGKTYSEVFSSYMPTAVKLMTQNVISAKEMGNNIIWDQTSTTINSRKKKFLMLPNYYKIAVVFKTPEAQEHSRRLNNRPGKIIPLEVITDMINNFQYPTIDEGFDEIWSA